MLIDKGTTRATLIKRSERLNLLVPIDYVVDVIICVSWHVTLHRNNEVKVYSYNSYNSTSNAYPLDYINTDFYQLIKVDPKLKFI